MTGSPSPRGAPTGSGPTPGPPGGWGTSVVVLLSAFLVPLAGCATKGDLKNLREEVRQQAAEQDSVLREIRSLSRAALDSLQAQREELLRFRGDFGRQLLAIEDQLVQIQELTGQSQRRIAELRDRMEARSRRLVRPPESPSDTTAGGETGEEEGPPPGRRSAGEAGDAEAAFNAALQQLRRGSLTTARLGFEEFLRAHAGHELAPHARFYLAETYEQENRLQEALDAFLRIPELDPTSDRVPMALYRAGRIEQERGNPDTARQYFQRVVESYPESDAASLARERLDEIGS